MGSIDHRPPTADVSARVRHNAGSAGLAALCLLFFGFFRFAPPTVTNLFTLGDAIFNYTLRAGGVAMGVIALWLLLGRPITLIVDAVATIAIGVLLALSAVMMILGGGFGLNQILYIVFGATFLASGVRIGRDYFLMARAGATTSSSSQPGAIDHAQVTPSATGGSTRRSQQVRKIDETARAEDVPSAAVETEAPTEKQEPEPPPPEGYLAALGKRNPPRQT